MSRSNGDWCSFNPIYVRAILFKNRKHVLRQALDRVACKALTFAKILEGGSESTERFIRTSFFQTFLACSGITTRNSNGTNLPQLRSIRSGGCLRIFKAPPSYYSDVIDACRYTPSHHEQIYDTFQPLLSTTSISITPMNFGYLIFPFSFLFLPSPILI